MVPTGAGAQNPIDEARRALDAARAEVDAARAEVETAQSAANEAAEAFFAAIDEQEHLDADIGALEAEIDDTMAEVELLATDVRDVVVNQYVTAEQTPGVLGDGDVNRAARADALSRFVANSRLDAVDEYRLVRGRLDDLRAELDERAARQVEVVAELAGAEQDANDRLAALTVERERLDERVAELAAEEARLVAEEEARRQAELEEQRRTEEAARQQALADNPPTPTAAPEPAASEPAEPTPAPTGAPEIPTGAAPNPATGWVCPVAGPTSFIDSWGAPRVSGRWHKGTDMMAEEGVPVVAVVGGTVEHRGNSVGGLSAHLTAPDGSYFYYTHLSGYANEGAGSVAQGTVIGYVGMTGNAPVPHLHFEFHPADVGGPVNPYPTLIATC